MESTNPITMAVAFMRQHPQAVAALLERQDAQSTACFLDTLPIDDIIPLLNHMLPHYISVLLLHWSEDKFVKVLAKLNMHLTVAVLRQLKPETRKYFIGKFPTKYRIHSERLLNFREEMVGAWMTPNALLLPDDCTTDDALTCIKSCPSDCLIDPFCVVNREHRLAGQVNIFDIIKAEKLSPLSAHMKKTSQTLNGHSLLIAEKEKSYWTTNSSIPVINSNFEVIGILTYSSLLAGIQKTNGSIHKKQDDDLFEPILDAYSHVLTLFVESLARLKTDPHAKEYS